MDPFLLLVFLVIVALAFDFLNGLHDAANSIATIVSTRVLPANYAVMWVAPKKKFAVVAATNSAGRDAELACDDACAQLIRRFLDKK